MKKNRVSSLEEKHFNESVGSKAQQKNLNGKRFSITSREAFIEKFWDSEKEQSKTQSSVILLTEIAHLSNDFALHSSLENTFYCQERTALDDVLLYKTGIHNGYCGSRFCTICSEVIKADVISLYKPIIEKWEIPFLVTLTITSVPILELKDRIAFMYNTFREIEKHLSKLHKKGNAPNFLGVKFFECNASNTGNDFSLSFRFIIPEELAPWLIVSWNERCRECSVKEMRKITNLEKDLNETIQFPTTKKNKASASSIFCRYTMYREIQQYKTVEHFGFNCEKTIAED